MFKINLPEDIVDKLGEVVSETDEMGKLYSVDGHVFMLIGTNENAVSFVWKAMHTGEDRQVVAVSKPKIIPENIELETYDDFSGAEIDQEDLDKYVANHLGMSIIHSFANLTPEDNNMTIDNDTLVGYVFKEKTKNTITLEVRPLIKEIKIVFPDDANLLKN